MNELETPDTEKEIGKVMKKRKTGKVINLKLKQINPYPKNAKIHTEAQIGKIRDSIITFGYKSLIEVDENDIILAGHGRLEALYQIDKTGSKEIPVLKITDLTNSEKKAYRIAHNKLNLDTGFDNELLAEEFSSLKETENFDDTGFTGDEIAKITDEKPKTNVSEHERSLENNKNCPKCGYELSKSGV